MKQKKYKKLNNREKQANKELKQEMRDKGILPPPKPRLNRKKFIEDTKQEWNDRSGYEYELYLMQAFSYMLGHYDHHFKVDLEAVGAAKVLKIAMKLKEFEDSKKAQGKTQYTLGEQMEYVKNIVKA